MKPEGFLPQRYVQKLDMRFRPMFLLKPHDHPSDRDSPPARDVTIAKLPIEILLEIFDFYRQTFGFDHQLNYERAWNNKNGWFKLAHVCRNWRSVVLTFSSQLRLRLYFTAQTSIRAAVLTALPPLPIVLDYLDVLWTFSLQNRLTSAPGYPTRVCRIAISVTDSKTIPKALNFAFPILESLELHITGIQRYNFPPIFLMTSSKSLRRLKIRSATLTPLVSLLLATTALVDLTLDINTAVCPLTGMSLLALLRFLPCLRHLDVSVQSYLVPPIHTVIIPVAPVETNDVVLLAELTYFCLKGFIAPVEQLISGLAIPSLRKLHVSLDCSYTTFHIPHLSELIRNAGIIFSAARISLSQSTFNLSLLTPSHFIDDMRFNILGDRPFMLVEIGSELSTMLTTVEDVLITLLPPAELPDLVPGYVARWRGFLEQLPNVKILRVLHGLQKHVVNLFRQDDGQPRANIFPSLEGIELHTKHPQIHVFEWERASALEPFEGLVAARQQAGRPVKVYWNTGQVLPPLFYCPTRRRNRQLRRESLFT